MATTPDASPRRRRSALLVSAIVGVLVIGVVPAVVLSGHDTTKKVGPAATVKASATPTPAPSPTADALHSTDRLEAKQTITSPNGEYEAAVLSDGQLVVRLGSAVAWAAPGTADHPGAYTVMQPDGNLVVYSCAGTALWSSKTELVTSSIQDGGCQD
jgi:hypothetical protein